MYVFISSLLSELLNLNYLFLIIIVFFERKDPIKVLSWVLLLLFIPILGFFAYIFFNARIIYTRKKHSDVIKSIDKHTSYEIKKQMELLENDRLNLPKELLNTCKSLIHMNSIYANSLFTSDNDIYVFTNGSEKFDKLFEDIKNAKESINILYFIIRNDSLGRELIRLLCEKAKEGITVNLMYDFIGNIMTRSKLFNDLKNLVEM